MMNFNRKLIFEDGTEYLGYAFGADCERVCEIVFNTSMTGYQEILSDPSYTYQAVVMPYPLIGNYGIAADDFESAAPSVGALIVSEYNDTPSNFRSIAALDEVMKKYGITGICGVDTRKLTRSIRDFGSRKILITDISKPTDDCVQILHNANIPKDAVSKVSCRNMRMSVCDNPHFSVAAIDCGMKENIVRSLNSRGCNVAVLPYNTSAENIMKLNPDGVFISNGPGDPSDVSEVVRTIKELRGKIPIFGICLGHQLICLSYGAKCYKLKFGHRGGNHPVRNLRNGKIEITSQNHSYAVNSESIKSTPLEITHINILDNTVEGVRCAEDKIFSVQYHPESAPGPEDSGYLFDEFIAMMEAEKNA